MPTLPERDGGALPEVDPHQGLLRTAWDTHSWARLDAAQDGLPISTGEVTRGGEQGSDMHGRSFNHGRPR